MIGSTDPLSEQPRIETCGYCTEKINLENGYYHEEVTDWQDEQHGTCEEFFYHRGCYRQKQESLIHV